MLVTFLTSAGYYLRRLLLVLSNVFVTYFADILSDRIPKRPQKLKYFHKLGSMIGTFSKFCSDWGPFSKLIAYWNLRTFVKYWVCNWTNSTKISLNLSTYGLLLGKLDIATRFSSNVYVQFVLIRFDLRGVERNDESKKKIKFVISVMHADIFVVHIDTIWDIF